MRKQEAQRGELKCPGHTEGQWRCQASDPGLSNSRAPALLMVMTPLMLIDIPEQSWFKLAVFKLIIKTHLSPIASPEGEVCIPLPKYMYFLFFKLLKRFYLFEGDGGGGAQRSSTVLLKQCNVWCHIRVNTGPPVRSPSTREVFFSSLENHTPGG